MRWTIWAAGLAALAGAPALAMQPGAPQDMAMAPGGWGPGGWSEGAGGGYGAPMAQGYGAPPMMVRHSDFRPLRPGQRLSDRWADPALTVRDPQRWGLGRPGPGMRWIRYYDDAVMVDPDGRVVTERGPIAWDRPHMGMLPPGHPPLMLPPGHPPIGPGDYPAPYPHEETYQSGPGTTVTSRVEPMAPPAIYGMPYVGGTVVSVTPGTVTTTTVTTERTEYRTVRTPARRVYRGKLIRRY